MSSILGALRICCPNSSPGVSHAIGNRTSRYSIIGDTVNTASRMESNSKPGKIQCSEVSANMLQQESSTANAIVKCRGEVHIKGKGEMILYWVQKAGQSSEEIHEEAIPEKNPAASATPLEPITAISSGIISTISRPSNTTSSQDVWTKAAVRHA